MAKRWFYEGIKISVQAAWLHVLFGFVEARCLRRVPQIESMHKDCFEPEGGEHLQTRVGHGMPIEYAPPDIEAETQRGFFVKQHEIRACMRRKEFVFEQCALASGILNIFNQKYPAAKLG